MTLPLRAEPRAHISRPRRPGRICATHTVPVLSWKMWLLDVLVPLLRLYMCGIKVLLYQMFNKSFTLPALPRLGGRVAIVTGATRGMGLETARHLAALDMHVILAGNQREEGSAAAKKINQECGRERGRGGGGVLKVLGVMKVLGGS
ncbi:polyprenol dehydrogenase [Menidia menidia]